MDVTSPHSDHHQDSQCCQPKTMCGHSLAKAIVVIGWTTMMMSTIKLASGVSYLFIHNHRESRDPVWSIMTVSAMTIVCLSAYEIVISVLMLWQRMQRRPKYFFYSMWYVSHLSLLTLYCLIFSAIVVVHISNGHFVWGMGYCIICTAYIALLVYFEVLVSSYMNSNEIEERYI